MFTTRQKPLHWLLPLLLLLWASTSNAQDPNRFRTEVSEITSQDAKIENKRNLIVFTGSSSVRLWESLENDFEGYNVINRAFGGSQMSDLLYYAENLILVHRPAQVFIYEGDNDLAHGKTPEVIIEDTRKLIARLRGVQPEIRIVLIAAKPSIARWRLHKRYEQFNLELQLLAYNDPKIDFADVWKPMLDENGVVQQDLFLEDNLHMNAKGYAIWKQVMLPLLYQPKR